jgi:hypothetical protein
MPNPVHGTPITGIQSNGAVGYGKFPKDGVTPTYYTLVSMTAGGTASITDNTQLVQVKATNIATLKTKLGAKANTSTVTCPIINASEANKYKFVVYYWTTVPADPVLDLTGFN